MPSENTCQPILELLDVMRRLRSPGGCPWDAEQTPLSLAPYILEEAAEVVDAIECGDPAAIQDEAGDLLLQVVFLAQIHSEQALFDFSDVARGISHKLIRRHPHVFEQNNQNLSTAELDQQWERIKRSEKPTDDCVSHPFGQIPVNLPALQRAVKLLNRADKVGMLSQIDHSSADNNPLTESELGEELFKLAARGRHAGLDPEQALRRYIRQLLDASKTDDILDHNTGQR